LKVKITGTGLYLPPKVETSKEISTLIGKSEEWIIRKSGVKERRVSEIDVDEMGAHAGREALGNGSLPDLIINASGVPKQTIPDTSTFFQKAMGLKGIPSFSIHCTCLSFITAFHTASSLIQTKSYKKILIISSDRGTRGRNFNEAESASLLGDGAAAIILESGTPSDSSKLMHFEMRTWPAGAHLTEVRGGGTNKHPQDPETLVSDNLFTMDGPGIYKIARKAVYKLMLNTLKSTNLIKEDIDLVIPHQASGKAVEAYIETGGFKREKVVNIVSKFGNCVAASVPMALVKSIKEKKIRRKDKILLIGTGAGLSAACALLSY
jgi:3-oxoacyl-[acyl-carrier-protein] synthase-3